jgi:hypothetical protein
VAIEGHGDLVTLVRTNEGRLLVIAPDAATAGSVEPGLLAPEAPIACYVTAPPGQALPSGWLPIAAAAGATCTLTQALALEPGRVLVVRPDLHSAGCIPPAALGALLGCYRNLAGSGLKGIGLAAQAGTATAGARA